MVDTLGSAAAAGRAGRGPARPAARRARAGGGGQHPRALGPRLRQRRRCARPGRTLTLHAHEEAAARTLEAGERVKGYFRDDDRGPLRPRRARHRDPAGRDHLQLGGRRRPRRPGAGADAPRARPHRRRPRRADRRRRRGASSATSWRRPARRRSAPTRSRWSGPPASTPRSGSRPSRRPSCRVTERWCRARSSPSQRGDITAVAENIRAAAAQGLSVEETLRDARVAVPRRRARARRTPRLRAAAHRRHPGLGAPAAARLNAWSGAVGPGSPRLLGVRPTVAARAAPAVVPAGSPTVVPAARPGAVPAAEPGIAPGVTSGAPGATLFPAAGREHRPDGPGQQSEPDPRPVRDHRQRDQGDDDRSPREPRTAARRAGVAHTPGALPGAADPVGDVRPVCKGPCGSGTSANSGRRSARVRASRARRLRSSSSSRVSRPVL